MDKLALPANELPVEEQVLFLGWKSRSELREIVLECDIGVVSHDATDHTNTTLPNKIFDYMAPAKPVFVSTAAALEEVVAWAERGLIT